MYNCKRAKPVWKTQSQIYTLGKGKASFNEWMEAIFSKANKLLVEDWLVLMMGVWANRNLAIFEGREKDALLIVEDQLALQENHRKAFSRLDKGRSNDQPTEELWKKPKEGFIKINCDASSTVEGAGIGVVARNEYGETCFVGAKRIQGGLSDIVAEAEALLWGLQCAVELELSHVEMESDCLQLIQQIKGDKMELGVMGVLVNKILMLSKGIVVSWNHVRRSGNEAAHWLSRLKPSCDYFDFICVDFPSVFEIILLKDLIF